LGTSAFYSTPSSLSIKVPSTSSVTAYQGADNWSYYQDKITAL
jgi:hypothetical protein